MLILYIRSVYIHHIPCQKVVIYFYMYKLVSFYVFIQLLL